MFVTTFLLYSLELEKLGNSSVVPVFENPCVRFDGPNRHPQARRSYVAKVRSGNIMSSFYPKIRPDERIEATIKLLLNVLVPKEICRAFVLLRSNYQRQNHKNPRSERRQI